jgi:two-component system chemotaxis response regulator CheV
MENNIVNSNDDELIRLVTSNSDASTQYVLFRNGEDKLFAINVAKVEELIIYKSLEIAANSDPNAISAGIIKFRGNMISLINFDRWLGMETKCSDEYELVMVCDYGNHKFGIIIKEVEGIISLEPQNLTDNSDKDKKMSFITEVSIKGEKQLCLIFDSDKMLLELFPDITEKKEKDLKNISSESITTKILVAEDSRIMQKTMCILFDKLNLNYEMFGNGKLLYDFLERSDIRDIGLIITDVEMPVMDGISLLSDIKKKSEFNELPVVINTNMGNPAILANLKERGAAHVIKKLDLGELKKAIIKYARRY